MSPRPPFADLAPTVEWQTNGVCNYDCTYCIQSPRTRTGAPDDATIDAIVDGLATLPGAWEVKMSGGEPFASEGFMRRVIPGLVARTPHRISVLTNFSAPLKVLEAFARATGERLRITSASLHLEHSSLAEFLPKAIAYRELRARHNPESSFVVNSVLVPGRLRELVSVKAAVEREGFRYFPQLMKIRGGVYPYAGRDAALVEELTGGSHDPALVNRAPDYQGLHCEAGAWYLVVDQQGDAWSCRTGKRFAQSDGARARLGNLADGSFARREVGGPCPYSICPCTVPANRGVVRIPVGHPAAAAPAVAL